MNRAACPAVPERQIMIHGCMRKMVRKLAETGRELDREVGKELARVMDKQESGQRWIWKW